MKSEAASAGERAKADQEAAVFVDGRKEQVETGKDDNVIADSQPSAVEQNQMRNMNKSEKYLKLCEVLLVAVILLVIVGVLLLPTIFYYKFKAGDFTIQTTAGSDNQNSSNTTPNILECSDGFYFDENGSSLCLPACGEWDLYPFMSYSILIFAIVCLVSSMIVIILALTVQRDKLLVFPSILLVYICGTLLLPSGIIIVGFSFYTALLCESMNYVDNLKEGNETVFCSIAGIIFFYSGIQTTVWTVLDAMFLFWAIVAPFSYQQLKLSGRIRIAHIISVLLGLLVPLPPPLMQLVHGYTQYFSIKLCTGYSQDYVYYTWLLPIVISIGITTFMQIYIIWTIFKEFVLRKLLNFKKVSSQIGKVEVKLILLSVHYNLFGILVAVTITFLYTGSFEDNLSEYFLCESNGGSGCQQYLGYIRTGSILIMTTFIAWLLTPVMMILFKINVFKNFFQKTCFKK